MNALYSYLLAAALTWMHVPSGCDLEEPSLACVSWQAVFLEDPEMARVRLMEVAWQLAGEACRRPGSPPERALRALRVLSLAREESYFALLVDDGTCNKPVLPLALQRRRAHGWCDGGTSWGMWQMRPSTLGDVHPEPLTGPELISDRALDIRIAWDLVGRRPQAWTTWEKAERRAAIWMVEHPLPKE
jgi:hypothetical protein